MPAILPSRLESRVCSNLARYLAGVASTSECQEAPIGPSLSTIFLANFGRYRFPLNPLRYEWFGSFDYLVMSPVGLPDALPVDGQIKSRYAAN